MTTDAQIRANRINGLASTGPRTPEGKAISSANATKHGLSAGFRVLSNENQQEFDELVAEYHRTFAPTNTHEQFLVEEMVQSRWRLARIRRLEAALVEQMVGLGDPADADSILAAALLDDTAGPFKTLQRYAAAAERTGHRALKQLQTMRRLEACAARNPAQRNEPNSPPPDHSGPADEAPPTRGNPSEDGGWMMSDDGSAGSGHQLGSAVEPCGQFGDGRRISAPESH
jgi:hypothetical protein